MPNAAGTPITIVPEDNLVPVSDHLRKMSDIPASRMFLINKSLAVYRQKYPSGVTYDASQGDGGASLPGVSGEILERAAELQRDHGSAYDMPYGTDAFRRSVVEKYWKFDAGSGIGPTHVLATVGGRDALMKAYAAMLALGHGRVGDMIIFSRVPWISYNWGPYGVGANVILAPGSQRDGWAYTEDGLGACFDFAHRSGRKIAGLIITNPDNPTGNTISWIQTTPPAETMAATQAEGEGITLYNYDQGENEAAPFAEQIEDILQHQLSTDPKLSSYKVDLGTGPDGGLVINVGDKTYTGTEQIPDERLRAAIRQAIDTYNQHGK